MTSASDSELLLLFFLIFFFYKRLCLRRRRQWHPTPVLFPGKSHGWRSLVRYSPWGHKELDMTKWFHFHFSLSCIGEGNGNPLQCSCLENPRDGGAWWAAVYGVVQSRTWLKWLSGSMPQELLQKLLAVIWVFSGLGSGSMGLSCCRSPHMPAIPKPC